MLVSDLFSAPAPPVAGEAPLLAVLTRHPARREGLAFAVHHAVAHPWWGQHVAVDARRARWLPEALASVSALAGLADAGAEKAARHQRALVLALPYQLARLAGAADAPVRGAVPGQGQARAAPEAVRSGKAALGLEAIRRAMSDTLYDATLRDLLREHGLGLLDEAVALERLAAAAPRPEVVRDLARRWLDEEHGDEDIGGLRPDLLLEYFVGDAAVDGGARELLGLLAGNAQLRGVIDAALGQGGGAPTLDGARLVGTLAALLGDEAPPELRRWLDLLAPLSGGGPPSRWGPEVLSGLAGQLGLDADGQAALQGAAALVFQLLEVPAEAPVAPGPPPE